MSKLIKLSIHCFIIIIYLCEMIRMEIVALSMIYREMWYAKPIDEDPQAYRLVATYVIVHESGGLTCLNYFHCRKVVQYLQAKDIATRGDIRYNFLIGGDGSIYEGRGWYKNSISIPEYDEASISIAFIGSYSTEFLSTAAWETFKNFLDFAVELSFLVKNYQLLGHQQFRIVPKKLPIYQAQCPSIRIFNLLTFHSHWVNKTIEINRP